MRRLLGSFLLFCAALVGQEKRADTAAPFVPSPQPVVKHMLDLGKLKPGQLHYDLGSGDGRLVIAAARDYGAKSIGFEIDPALVDLSRKQIVDLNLSALASIESRDLFEADYSKPDLITVYLLPRALERLRPLLEEQMKPGSLVISHDFSVPGWEADEVFTLDEELETEDLLHSIFVYRR